jgi:hypothetical protein
VCELAATTLVALAVDHEKKRRRMVSDFQSASRYTIFHKHMASTNTLDSAHEHFCNKWHRSMVNDRPPVTRSPSNTTSMDNEFFW